MKEILFLLVIAATLITHSRADTVICTELDDGIVICTDEDGEDTTIITIEE